MAEEKNLILQYLLSVTEATALTIAKNLGVRGVKQINPTLYSLEKQGEVVKNGEVTPPTWELSPHCKERMERILKAKRTSSGQSEMKEQCFAMETTSSSVFAPSLPSSIPGLEPIPLQEDGISNNDDNKVCGVQIFLYKYATNILHNSDQIIF